MTSIALTPEAMLGTPMARAIGSRISKRTRANCTATMTSGMSMQVRIRLMRESLARRGMGEFKTQNSKLRMQKEKPADRKEQFCIFNFHFACCLDRRQLLRRGFGSTVPRFGEIWNCGPC